jgi:excisionase family DNA binding protein
MNSKIDLNSSRQYYHACDNKQQPSQGHSVDEVGKIGGWSRSTTYRLIKDGQLKIVKIRGRRIITSDALGALLREGAEAMGPNSKNPALLTAGQASKAAPTPLAGPSAEGAQ